MWLAVKLLRVFRPVHYRNTTLVSLK